MTAPIKISKNHDYAQIKQDAKDHIDGRAAQARKKHISDGHGQEYVYNEKYIEAKLYLEGHVDFPDLPFLNAEVSASGGHPQEIARGIVEAKLKADLALAKIEQLRRAAKMKIDEAPNRISDIWRIAKDTHF